MSLYLKYRPQTFSDLVGQEAIVKTLSNALTQGRVVHAYLFCGPRGTGKTSMARLMAKSINCANRQEADPCNQCNSCAAIQQSHWVDLIEIDAASNRGIDEIRDLKEKINYSPSQGAYKIYIIDEVHMLTKEAFNALLKTLEEPPSHTYFILATTEAHKIPETIRSRCQQFYFNSVSDQQIQARLEQIAEWEGVRAEPEALQWIAAAAKGGVRDAVGLFEQNILNGTIEQSELQKQMGWVGVGMIEKWVECFKSKDVNAALESVEAIVNQGHNLANVLSELIQYLRKQMLQAARSNQPTTEWIEWIEHIQEAKAKMNQSVVVQLPVEVAMIKICTSSSAIQSVPTLQHSSGSQTEKAPIEKITPTEPAQSQKTEAISVNLEEIQKNWNRITQQLRSPIVKMSLMDGKPVSLSDQTLTLQFNSLTLMEKVSEPKNRGEVMDCLEEVMGTKMEIKLKIKTFESETTAELAADVFN
ncbi:DNA polymerase III subunit gamma/tau [Candidatus Peregrinibacteria bacterium]|nr:MAG: DNA polymerase III subunit gamma/tau [Candidatus Peregrinibacteria bacterium]